MPPEDAQLEDTRAWLAKAELDLRAADLELGAPQAGLWGDVAFHAQQAAEKALKALLALHDEPFRKTHRIEELGQACMEIAPGLGDLFNPANPRQLRLANTAHASVKLPRTAVTEFFRHVRNAASHRNRFNFSDDEPRWPAEWRGKALDHVRKGRANPLHGVTCFHETLGPADLFLLLSDVEKLLP
jgi:hypothetical protein